MDEDFGPRRREPETEMIIARAPAEVYAFFRNPENLLPSLDDSVTIRPVSPGRWKWTVQGSAGMILEWTISIAEMVEPEHIFYRTEAAEGSVEWKLFFIETEDPGRTLVRSCCSTADGEMALAILSLVGRNPAVETCASLRRSGKLLERG